MMQDTRCMLMQYDLMFYPDEANPAKDTPRAALFLLV